MHLSDEFTARDPADARTNSHDAADHDSAARASRSETPGDGTRPGDSQERAATSDRLLSALAEFVGEIAGSAEALIEVYKDRVRLSVRRTIVRSALTIGAALCAAVWIGAAALAVLRGLCGGLTSAFGGREWLGELAGGALALALTAAVISVHVRSSARRELERLSSKYQGIRNEHANDADSATPSNDPRGAA